MAAGAGVALMASSLVCSSQWVSEPAGGVGDQQNRATSTSAPYERGPSGRSRATSSPRLRTPTLENTDFRWSCTVLAEMKRRPAMSAAEWPAITSTDVALARRQTIRHEQQLAQSVPPLVALIAVVL